MTNPDKDYKQAQKELTELNSDGNEGIGEEGEALVEETPEEATLRKRIEELRKRDPFIYR
jgi:hypothetical protein